MMKSKNTQDFISEQEFTVEALGAATDPQATKKSQRVLDQEQYYDLDGVTRIDKKIVIPSNSKFKKVTQLRTAL